MTKLRRIVLTLALALTVMAAPFAVVSSVSAASTPLIPTEQLCSQADPNDLPAICVDKVKTTDPITGPSGVILRVANLVAFIGGVFAVFVIVVSGIRYIMSSGDSARINTAKNAILFSVIGIVIIALANTIVRFIVSRI